MQNTPCPTCGHETATDRDCSTCGHVNGVSARSKPTPPPEVADWVIERPTPEMLEEARRTFDEAEYLAALQEMERTGGVQIDDLIADLERRINGSA